MKRSGLLLALLVNACGVDETGIPPPSDALWFPQGMAPHPDGRYLYVANAIFDRKFNRGTVVVFDTYEGRVLPDATVELGLFAAEVRAARQGDAVRLFVPTRDDARLTVLTVNADRGDAAGHLGCDATRAGDAEDDLARVCGGSSYVDLFAGEVDVTPLAADPLGLALDAEGLFVSHVGRGVVSRWSYQGDGDEPIDFRCSLTLSEGATSVAVHPSLGWAYVTDRAGNLVQVVEPLDPGQLGQRGVTTREACRLEPRTPIQVDRVGDSGSTHGLAFSADGSLLYVASAFDESLRIYDTSVGPGGTPRNRLVAAIPLGGGPDVVRVAGLRPGESSSADEPADGPVARAVAAKGGGLVYVTAFDEDRVVVIDPTTLSVLRHIEVGDGPHEIVFMPDGAGRLRGYVSEFRDHRVSVLDLEPGSASRFTRVAVVP